MSAKAFAPANELATASRFAQANKFQSWRLENERAFVLCELRAILILACGD